jgi:hypothetical protein
MNNKNIIFVYNIMPAQSISLNNAYNDKLRKMLYDLEHVDIINHQPEMLGGGSHEYQRHLLPGNSGQYPPIHMLAEQKAMGGALLMERPVGGAMPKKRVKKAVKEAVKKAVKKAVKEEMKEESSSDEEKMGGKVNRMRKAKKWTDYAEDTAKKALGLADMAKTMAGAKPKKVNARAVVVKKVMADKGMSMIEASKFVKANGLYKPK